MGFGLGFGFVGVWVWVRVGVWARVRVGVWVRPPAEALADGEQVFVLHVKVVEVDELLDACAARGGKQPTPCDFHLMRACMGVGPCAWVCAWAVCLGRVLAAPSVATRPVAPQPVASRPMAHRPRVLTSVDARRDVARHGVIVEV